MTARGTVIRVILRLQEHLGRSFGLLAQCAALLHPLEEEYGQVESNQDNIDRAEGISIETCKANLLKDFCEMPQCFRQNHQQVEGVEEYKRQEVGVVSVPKTIVNEWTVMIKVLYALATYGAVEGRL